MSCRVLYAEQFRRQLDEQLEGVELRRVVFGVYLIVYRVEEKNQEVQVYGFRHAARLP